MLESRKQNVLRKKAIIKLLILVGFVLIILTSFGLGKEIVRRQKINEEIEFAKNEIQNFENKNKELSQLIEYLQTDSFKEIQARQNLGYKKEGEVSVSIESEAGGYDDESEASFTMPEQEDISNFKRWWNLFFAKKE